MIPTCIIQFLSWLKVQYSGSGTSLPLERESKVPDSTLSFKKNIHRYWTVTDTHH